MIAAELRTLHTSNDLIDGAIHVRRLLKERSTLVTFQPLLVPLPVL